MEAKFKREVRRYRIKKVGKMAMPIVVALVGSAFMVASMNPLSPFYSKMTEVDYANQYVISDSLGNDLGTEELSIYADDVNKVVFHHPWELKDNKGNATREVVTYQGMSDDELTEVVADGNYESILGGSGNTEIEITDSIPDNNDSYVVGYGFERISVEPYIEDLPVYGYKMAILLFLANGLSLSLLCTFVVRHKNKFNIKLDDEFYDYLINNGCDKERANIIYTYANNPFDLKLRKYIKK